MILVMYSVFGYWDPEGPSSPGSAGWCPTGPAQTLRLQVVFMVYT